MRWFMRCLMAFGLILSLVIPAGAEEVQSLPPVQTINSVNERLVITVDGIPIAACRGQWETFNRNYTVCNYYGDIPELGYQKGDTIEFVTHDGFLYLRRNSETRWMRTEDIFYDPSVTFSAYLVAFPEPFTVSNLGSRTIGSVPTTQYQLWSRNAEFNGTGQLTQDLFIGNDGWIYGSNFSDRSSFGENRTVDFYSTYSDFNSAIKVYPPVSSSVDGTDYTLTALERMLVQR